MTIDPDDYPGKPWGEELWVSQNGRWQDSDGVLVLPVRMEALEQAERDRAELVEEKAQWVLDADLWRTRTMALRAYLDAYYPTASYSHMLVEGGTAYDLVDARYGDTPHRQEEAPSENVHGSFMWKYPSPREGEVLGDYINRRYSGHPSVPAVEEDTAQPIRRVNKGEAQRSAENDLLWQTVKTLSTLAAQLDQTTRTIRGITDQVLGLQDDDDETEEDQSWPAG